MLNWRCLTNFDQLISLRRDLVLGISFRGKTPADTLFDKKNAPSRVSSLEASPQDHTLTHVTRIEKRDLRG